MRSEQTQRAVDDMYRYSLHCLAGVDREDTLQMPLPVLHGLYDRVLLPRLRSGLYWSAILSRPDLFQAGIAGSTRVHEAQASYRAQLTGLIPETLPWPRTFHWGFASPVADIGLEQDCISLLGHMATVFAPHAGLEFYYKTGWRAQLLLELVSSEQNGGPRRFRSPEARERYSQLLEMLAEPEIAALVRGWVNLQGTLLTEVSHMASFQQVTAAHAITALKQSRGYRPRELWRLTELVMER
jgi:hypothetical protein